MCECVCVCVCVCVSDVCIHQKILENFLSPRIDISEKCVCVYVCVCMCVYVCVYVCALVCDLVCDCVCVLGGQ